MLATVLAVLLSLLGSRPVFADSIQDLPQLSHLLIHHWDCRMMIVLEPGPTDHEEDFTMLPGLSGHEGFEHVAVLGQDKLDVAVNQQMIMLQWTRGTQTVAEAQTMIQNSPTSAYVLIAYDPANDQQQSWVSCNAVMYADVPKATVKP